MPTLARLVAVSLLGITLLASSGSAGVIVGAQLNDSSHVKVFVDDTSVEQSSFFAYGGPTPFGVRVAGGDVNGDTISDIITGVAGGGLGHVKVFDGVTGAEVRSFFAYAGGADNGMYVGAGRINADAVFDIITGVDSGPAAHVKVFDGATNAEIRSFFAYPLSFTGGVRVAGGDVNGDGFDDIITGAGNGGGGHVKAFDSVTNAELRSFFAFGSPFSSGVFVAAGDVNGDSFAEIVVGTGEGVAPDLRVFDGASGLILASTTPYAPTFTGGVRVAVGDIDLDGDLEIITGPGNGGGGQVRIFDGATLNPVTSYLAFGSGYAGGVYVGANHAVPEPTSAVLLFAGCMCGVHHFRARR